jgi:hypothetical protein
MVIKTLKVNANTQWEKKFTSQIPEAQTAFLLITHLAIISEYRKYHLATLPNLLQPIFSQCMGDAAQESKQSPKIPNTEPRKG